MLLLLRNDTGSTTSTAIALSDNFDDNSIDVAKWSTIGTGEAETSSQIQIPTQAGTTNYNGLQSLTTTFDFTGKYAHTQVVNAGNQSLASLQALPVTLAKDASNALVWYISGNVIGAQKQVAGSFSTVRADTAYNSAVHKYFRIREYGGVTYWEFSTTGDVGSWTEYASITNPFAITTMSVLIRTGTYASEVSSTTAIYDNFNTLPVTSSANSNFFQFF